jgi:hypothetical protein
MSKKGGLPDNFDWPAMLESTNSILGKAKDKGPDYCLSPMVGYGVSPAVKVPKAMFNKLNTIAKANMIEPWEVIQELLEFRFKESA